MTSHEQFIHGTCHQLLFSPKGGIEGALLKMRGTLVQVSVPADRGDGLLRATGPGRPLRVLATPDHSPKAVMGAHRVFRFTSFADASGRQVKPPDAADDDVTVKGVVHSWHFARHGEPNGVMLETGEFIHMRPHGVAAVELGIGSKVIAVGELRMTALGTRMLEARRVNRVKLG